uniref:hypothetical protein n=1 Tax=Prevotella micans TaxID=189723 RepID=UPI000ACFB196|nr:hypothetical protein [Prevotella micans]
MQIYASVDDADTLCLGTFQYNDGTTGWYRHVIDLNQYTGKGNITFQVYGYTADASATLYVDQFRIDAYADNDIAIQSYDIPTRMNIGQPHQLKARVINAGSKSTGVYTVALYKDNAQVSSQQGAAWLRMQCAILYSMHKTSCRRPATLFNTLSDWICRPMASCLTTPRPRCVYI